MSLNWDVSKVTGREKWMWYKATKDSSGEYEKGTELLNPITERLIFLTMVVGIGNWTEANIKEVFYRVRSYEIAIGKIYPDFWKGRSKKDRTLGGRLRKDTFDENGYISFAEVARHVGLSTNVSNETSAWWRRKLDDIMRREVERSINSRREQ